MSAIGAAGEESAMPGVRVDSSIFNGLARTLVVLSCLCVLFVPLGLWKLIELLSAFFHHVRWQ